MKESEPITKHPFKGSTVFMLGNEVTQFNTQLLCLINNIGNWVKCESEEDL